MATFTDFGKTKVGSYLRKDITINRWKVYYPSSEKVFGIAGSIITYLVGDFSILKIVNSGMGQYLLRTRVKPFVEDTLRVLMEDASQKNFLYKLQASFILPREGLSLVDFSKCQYNFALAMKINQFNPIIEAHFGTKNTIGMEYFWKQFEWSMKVPFVEAPVADIPMKLKFKPVFDFGDKNISISTVLYGGKLFECGANVGLTWPCTPLVGASVTVNLGWIDAALTLKPKGMTFNGNYNIIPEIGFHIKMKHDEKQPDSMTKGSLSIIESNGARKISVNPRGIMIVEAKIELPYSSYVTWKVKCDVKEKRVGLKLVFSN